MAKKWRNKSRRGERQPLTLEICKIWFGLKFASRLLLRHFPLVFFKLWTKKNFFQFIFIEIKSENVSLMINKCLLWFSICSLRFTNLSTWGSDRVHLVLFKKKFFLFNALVGGGGDTDEGTKTGRKFEKKTCSLSWSLSGKEKVLTFSKTRRRRERHVVTLVIC